MNIVEFTIDQVWCPVEKKWVDFVWCQLHCETECGEGEEKEDSE